MKEIVIKFTKMILVLPENELLKCIPPSLLLEGIKRGKQYKRLKRVSQYEESRIYPTKQDLFEKENKNYEK
jgi:hypothetical protein